MKKSGFAQAPEYPVINKVVSIVEISIPYPIISNAKFGGFGFDDKLIAPEPGPV